MAHDLNPDVEAVLQCPGCCVQLARTSNAKLSCYKCGSVYGSNATGSLDLRLQKPRSVSLTFHVPFPFDETDIPYSEDLPPSPSPQVDFGAVPIPRHLTRELMSYFPKASGKGSLMLDLGCGNAGHRQVCEHAGFTYVGIDYENPEAPLLADAHALPFRDESFEFLLSAAVFEHIQFPFVAIREAQRVLKPGCIFIGTVAFLEPFHANSFYHHSRMGTLNTLLYGGFHIVHVAASTKWTVFAAQARMSGQTLFPRLPNAVSRSLILLPERMSRAWWRVGLLLKSRITRSRKADAMSGAFYFVVKKPDA